MLLVIAWLHNRLHKHQQRRECYSNYFYRFIEWRYCKPTTKSLAKASLRMKYSRITQWPGEKRC
jgi:hypothetical protein